MGLIGALILGKVIMIGSIFRLGRWLEDKPLIGRTVDKALIFSVFVLVLRVDEYDQAVVARGRARRSARSSSRAKGIYEVLANLLVVLVTLIPFFAVKELGRVLGRERVAALFFRNPVEG